MAINHAETSILIDGVDTRNMSDDLLLRQYTDIVGLLSITSGGHTCMFGGLTKCSICRRRTMQVDVMQMELQARGLTAKQEQGQTV